MPAHSPSIADSSVEEFTLRLLAYCQANGWAGYDPYDVLNSRLLKALPFLDFRVARVAFTQTLKRSPINIRPLLGIPKKQNAKALGLFLSAALNLRKVNVLKNDVLLSYLLEQLIALRAQSTAYWCWGYSFPWQMRTDIVPEGYPNLVCTVFVANALFDAYEELRDERCLSMALSAVEYIATELYWSDGNSAAGFAYPLPSFHGRVHNANFLGAALLCRAARYGERGQFLDRALAVTRHSVAAQHPNGSWLYGELPSQHWIDNFHTGYNLCALQAISRYVETSEFEHPLRRGFDFYRRHFFNSAGEARYFHDHRYPIDIHCVAQSLITLTEFADYHRDSISMADRVLGWTMRHMWDDQGFFYYRVLPLLTIRTSYMRWSQAWMLLALSRVLLRQRSTTSESPRKDIALVGA